MDLKYHKEVSIIENRITIHGQLYIYKGQKGLL